MAPLQLAQAGQASALATLVAQAAVQEATRLGLGPGGADAGTWQPGPEQSLLGVWRGPDLLGALAVAPDAAAGAWRIGVLVVHPAHQRQGMARALLQQTLASGPASAFVVAVAAGNAPARALYAGLGFEIWRQGQMGPSALPVLDLRRTADRREMLAP